MRYKIFEYVPMSKPKALSKMLPKIIRLGANVILDIEDSVQDTLNQENTPILKEEARQSIPILMDELLHKGIDIGKNIYIRINSFESGELEKDIEIIKSICNKVDTIGIFVPMIKHIGDIYNIKDYLNNEFKSIKIVPIIETVEGYRNLQEILDNANILNIEYVHYGHYDYSLDSKQWPFVDQDEKSFWDFISDIIYRIEKANLRYMHTPFGSLTEEELYKSIIKKLTVICCQDFAVTALNYNQVLFAKDIGTAKDLKYCESPSINQYELAEDVVNIFENNQCSKRSFSIDIKKAKFLTPHEYKMAKQYLKGLNDERN